MNGINKFSLWILKRIVKKQVRQEMYYLQDSRSFTGNDVTWWGKNGLGYTTDLRDAHQYTLEDALKRHRCRETDLPWLKSYIDTKSRPAVDFQYLDKAMIATTRSK